MFKYVLFTEEQCSLVSAQQQMAYLKIRKSSSRKTTGKIKPHTRHCRYCETRKYLSTAGIKTFADHPAFISFAHFHRHGNLGPVHGTYPQVSVGQVWGRGVGGIDGLFAVNLDDAAVLDVSDVLQLVEDIARLVLDQDGRVGRLEHAGCQLLRKHVHDESVQRVQAAQLVGDVHASRLIAVLQEQDT